MLPSNNFPFLLFFFFLSHGSPPFSFSPLGTKTGVFLPFFLSFPLFPFLFLANFFFLLFPFPGANFNLIGGVTPQKGKSDLGANRLATFSLFFFFQFFSPFLGFGADFSMEINCAQKWTRLSLFFPLFPFPLLPKFSPFFHTIIRLQNWRWARGI